MNRVLGGEVAMDLKFKTPCESNHGVREIFSKIMEVIPLRSPQHHKILKASWLDTKLGPMLAIADDDGLYVLEFADKHGLERKIERVKLKAQAIITLGIAPPITSITTELDSYFRGTLKEFKTPLHFLGSPFQKRVWEMLRHLPYGQTRSYKAQAEVIGRHTAYRAVANANGANHLAIIIPCHRIITSRGDLGGYGGGIARKQWLIHHEKYHA